jgi:hypothetical protein
MKIENRKTKDQLEREETADFTHRVMKIKRDPELSKFSFLISGIYEESRWTFVCGKHLSGRYKTEEDLKKHFAKLAHRKNA